jgi:hypothetical protein
MKKGLWNVVITNPTADETQEECDASKSILSQEDVWEKLREL